MKDLGQVGFHPGSLAGCQDHDGHGFHAEIFTVLKEKRQGQIQGTAGPFFFGIDSHTTPF
jgi:hypothetical protein